MPAHSNTGQDSHHNRSSGPPPFLWSIPGAGNTGTRFLIDQASGLHSGSLYNDMKLAKAGFPAEAFPVSKSSASECRILSVIKTHEVSEKNLRQTCGGKVDSAIFLVRHPLMAMWADYQRFNSNNDHSAAIQELDSSTINAFVRFARIRAVQVARTFLKCAVNTIDELWVNTSRKSKTFPSPFIFHSISYLGWTINHGKTRAMWIRYEDLQNPQLREQELARLLKFSGLSFTKASVQSAFKRLPSSYSIRKRIFSIDNVLDSLDTSQWATFQKIWNILRNVSSPFGYELHGRTPNVSRGPVDMLRPFRPHSVTGGCLL